MASFPKPASNSTAPNDASGTVLIGKTTWAINLTWETTSDPKVVERFARAKAKQKSIKTYAIHRSPDGTVEYGLSAAIGRGHANGMPTLASALVASRPGTWLAFFELPDQRVYFIGSNNGAIDPQSDFFYNDREKALEALAARDSSDSMLGVQHQVFAPDDFELGERATPWPTALSTLKPNAKLRLVDPWKPYRDNGLKVLGIGLILVVCWYAWNLFQYQPPLQKKVEKIAAAPWINRESGIDLAVLCLQALQKAPPAGVGWASTGLICKNGTVVAGFHRARPVEAGGNPLSWFVDAVTAAGYPIEGFRSLSQSAIYHYSVPVAPKIWKDEDVINSIDYYLPTLARRLDDLFLNGQIGKPDGKYYVTRKITIHTKTSPDYALPAFSDIPGLTLDSVAYNPHGGFITILELHEREPLPTNTKIQIDPPPPVRQFDARFMKLYTPVPAWDKGLPPAVDLTPPKIESVSRP